MYLEIKAATLELSVGELIEHETSRRLPDLIVKFGG
jgi:hypothetical protein